MPAGVKKTDESLVIRQLIHKYGYSSLTFQFSGNTEVLYKRFLAREKTPERGQANRMGFEPSWRDFDEWCHNLDAFSAGGEAVKVDTTDFNSVDFERCFEIARRFIQ